MNNVYYFDAPRNMLWIIPPKNASTSIKHALGLGKYIERDAAEALSHCYTVGVIRHPLDRVVSALYSALMECTPFEDRLIKNQHDSHVRPQYPAFDGMRVDFWVRVDRIAEDWKLLQAIKPVPDIGHENAGSRSYGRPADWREACDWTPFMPTYEQDFSLCRDWQRP